MDRGDTMKPDGCISLGTGLLTVIGAYKVLQWLNGLEYRLIENGYYIPFGGAFLAGVVLTLVSVFVFASMMDIDSPEEGADR